MIAAMVIAALALAGAEAKKLTVEEAEAMAVRVNARQRTTQALANASHEVADATYARLLPQIHVTDEFQHFDSPFDISMGTAMFRVREQETNTLTISAAQPVLGLFRIWQEAKAGAQNAYAADENSKAAESRLREAVRISFLRCFEAVALEEVARASQALLNAQLEQTQATLKAGVSTQADFLRVKVAVANAKGREIAAHSEEEIARAQLLAAIGLDPNDQTIALAEPTALIEASNTPLESADIAVERARTQRHELKARELEASAADYEERARWYALLPDVDAELAYLRVDGQIFAPPNSGFVGARVTWAAWDWGANWDLKNASVARAEAARLQQRVQETEIRVEVAAAMSRERSAAAAVEVAREAIAGAEEAHRETEAQVRAGVATTTDLLDTEAAWTQAKLNYERARYEEAIARVTLTRVTGE